MDTSQFIINLPDVIGEAVKTNPMMGYIAIFLAMFLENIFPPIPSELIMPLGGFYIQQGALSFFPVVLAGLLGTLLGSLPWYGIGRIVNEKRISRWLQNHGRWLGIKSEDLYRTRRWFNRYGTSLVFWGRLIPGIRTLISVPAGIEIMPILPFIFWTTAGSFLWTLFLTIGGFILGESYSQVELWIEPVSRAIKFLLICIIVFLISIVIIRLWKNVRSKFK